MRAEDTQQYSRRERAEPVVLDLGRRRKMTPRVPLALRGIRAFFGALGAVAPKTAGRLASRMFLKTRRHRVPAREKRWLEDSVRKDFAVNDGIEIATYWRGNGPVVLLLHGWEGRGSQMGAFVEPLVNAGFQTVAVDLPAHGNSPGNSTDGFTCGRALRELGADIGAIHGIVAHSFGGTCSLLAMAGGLRVNRTVLISPGVEREAFFEGFANIVGLPERATDEVRRLMIERFGEHEWSVFTPQRLGEVLDTGSGDSLIVHDVDDDEVPYNDSVELIRRAASVHLISTRGAGHRRILREPRVVERVTTFIAGG
jgi:pimeloyl-ACP methyl ester carboxylesterase